MKKHATIRGGKVLLSLYLILVSANIILSQDNRLSFVDTAYRRISAVASEEEIKLLMRYIDAWKTDSSDSNWEKCINEIYSMASQKSINSTVKISTVPNQGATIKYRLIGDSSEKEANRPSNCDQTMGIGYYYFWSERNGKRTSQIKGPVSIVKEIEEVVLTEK